MNETALNYYLKRLSRTPIFAGESCVVIYGSAADIRPTLPSLPQGADFVVFRIPLDQERPFSSSLSRLLFAAASLIWHSVTNGKAVCDSVGNTQRNMILHSNYGAGWIFE